MAGGSATVAIVRPLFRWCKRLAVASLLCLTVGYVGLIALQYQPLVIVTGSMQKTIPVGSLVVDRSVDPSLLRVGDVISFQKPIGARGVDTHRIFAIKIDRGRKLIQTKGDSNPIVDPWLLHYDQGMTAHRMVFSVPYLGNALLFGRSGSGRLALLAFAAFVILLSVFKVIAAAEDTQRGTVEAGGDSPAATAPETARLAAVPSAPQRAPSAPSKGWPPLTAVPNPHPAAWRPHPVACEPFHDWDVAYYRGELGEDGIWRFPHHCRECSAELLARNVVDAKNILIAQTTIVAESPRSDSLSR